MGPRGLFYLMTSVLTSRFSGFPADRIIFYIQQDHQQEDFCSLRHSASSRLSRSLSNLTRIGERDAKSIVNLVATSSVLLYIRLTITKKLIFRRNAKSMQSHVSGIHASYAGRCSSSRRKTPAVMVSPIPTVVTGLSQWSDGATQTE